jgi:16S rRNA processing protein RimM
MAGSSPAARVPDSSILLGVIGRPYGVRGLVRVTSYADDLTAYGPLRDDKGRHFVLRWRGEDIAELAELVGGAEVQVANRSAAASLTNSRLYVDRAQLPEPDEDEFYFADLIGLAAFDTARNKLGIVTAVHDHGAGVSLEIARPDAGPVLVPFTRACVPTVDVPAGMVVVEPPDVIEAAPGAMAESR